MRNYFTTTTYGLRRTAHAHCQFCDFGLKSPFISEMVGDRSMVTMERYRKS